MSAFLEKADRFAAQKHLHQDRKFEHVPYIVHPRHVASIVSEFTDDEEVIAAALLHDTLEDTETTPEEIRLGFGERVLRLVLDLTNEEEKKAALGKTPYLVGKMKELEGDALLLKLADRLSNVSGLENSPPEFQARYARESFHMMEAVPETRMNSAHRELRYRILQKIEPFLGDR